MAIKKSKDYKIKYTNEYLLDYLMELSIKLGRTPTGKDIKNEGKFKPYIYSRSFGKLSNAQKAVGLVPNKIYTNNKNNSYEYLIEYLRELSKKLGRTLTGKDIQNEGKIKLSVYIRNFGNLSNAHKAAGLAPNKKRRIKKKYTDEYLIDYLKEFSKQLGKTATTKDLYKKGKISAETYRNRFGSLISAQKAAGLVPNINSGLYAQKKYSNEYLLNYLKELSKKLGRTATSLDVKMDGVVSSTVFHRYFGSFCNAQNEAGLVPGIKITQKKRYTEEYLINEMIELSKKLGRTPSSLDLEKAHKVSPITYRNYFGSFIKAQIAAGLVPNRKQCERIYSDEYLLNYLKEISKQLGRTPKVADFVQSGKASAGVYYCRFGGLKNAIKAAGLVSKERIKHKK